MKRLNKQTKARGSIQAHKGRWWKDSWNLNNYEHVNKHRVQLVTWVLGRARMFVKCGGGLCFECASSSVGVRTLRSSYEQRKAVVTLHLQRTLEKRQKDGHHRRAERISDRILTLMSHFPAPHGVHLSSIPQPSLILAKLLRLNGKML